MSDSSANQTILLISSTGLLSTSIQNYIINHTSFDLIVLTSGVAKASSSTSRLKVMRITDSQRLSSIYPRPSIHTMILLSWFGTPREPLDSIQPYDYLYTLFQSHIEYFKPSQVFFISTSGALYPSSNRLYSEKDNPQPTTQYGIQKLRFEKLLSSLSSRLNIKYNSLRLSSIFGPLDLPTNQGIINTWSHNLLLGNPLRVFNTSNSVLNLLDSRTASCLIVQLLTVNRPEGPIILASPESITTASLIEIFSSFSHLQPTFEPIKPLVHRQLHLDTALLRKTLPTFTFQPVPSLIYNCIQAIASKYE